jgi:hypothetical protein
MKIAVIDKKGGVGIKYLFAFSIAKDLGFLQ